MTKIYVFLKDNYMGIRRGTKLELVAITEPRDYFYVVRPDCTDDGIMNITIRELLRFRYIYAYLTPNHDNDQDVHTLCFDRRMLQNKVEVVDDDQV